MQVSDVYPELASPAPSDRLQLIPPVKRLRRIPFIEYLAAQLSKEIEMQPDEHWFTEEYTACGSAFSMKITEKLHEEQSTIQHIEIYQTEHFGKLMVIDGCVMLTDRDNFIYHEMITHPALVTHRCPERVVIIGGGDCGTLREVLKHKDLKEVWQIDIDERVTRLAERFFPQLCDRNDDSRARFKFGDGIAWIKQAPQAEYDVIIVDSTDPVGPAEGLFSIDFYRNCRRALRPDGIIVQQSESPLYHANLIKEMHSAMKAGGFMTTRTLTFPQCSYPSGWWSVTMAGSTDALSNTPRFREAGTLDTRYYNEDVHQAALSMPNFLKTILGE